MPFSEQDYEKIRSWMNEQNPTCPVCGEGQFDPLTDFLSLPAGRAVGVGLKNCQTALPFVPLSCIKCGYLVLVTPLKIGIPV